MLSQHSVILIIIFRQAKSKRPPVKSSISVPVGEFSRSISMSPEHHNNLANNPPSPATTSGASAAKCKNLSIYDSYIESLLSRYRPRFFDQVGHQTTYSGLHNSPPFAHLVYLPIFHGLNLIIFSWWKNQNSQKYTTFVQIGYFYKV